MSEQYEMTCGSCGLAKKCTSCGLSPLSLDDNEDDSVTCIVLNETRRGILVAIPSAIVLDAKSGNARFVSVKATFFKRPWWARLVWK